MTDFSGLRLKRLASVWAVIGVVVSSARMARIWACRVLGQGCLVVVADAVPAVASSASSLVVVSWVCSGAASGAW